MKIKHKSYYGNIDFDSIKEAAKDALVPDVYSYEGTLEGLSAKIEKLQEMLAALISHTQLNSTQLQDILGYGFEVEE